MLVVEGAQVDADLRHLLVHAFPVGFLERALANVLARAEEPVHLVVRHVPDLVPDYLAIGRDAEGLAHRLHRHVPRRRYRPSRHPLLAELHYELRPCLSRHGSNPLRSADIGMAGLFYEGSAGAIRMPRNGCYAERAIISSP